jgi:hypothetical protein
MKRGDELRPHLDAMLADLEAAPPPPDRWYPEGMTVAVPVYRDGKIIGHVNEDVEQYRGDDEWRSHINRVRALRAALDAGDDPYLIAWLALSVGGGSQLPSIIFEDNSKARLGHGRRGRHKVPPEVLRTAFEARMAKPGEVSRKEACRRVAKEYGVSYKTVERAIE